MKLNKVVIASLSVILSDISLAGTMGKVLASELWSQVITLSLGPAWYGSGNSQTLFLQPDIQKKYVANDSSAAFVNGEFFLGLQHALNSNLKGQLGLTVAASSNARLDGDIWEDSDPDFNNYFYTYKINHAHIAVKGKILADMGVEVQPYVSASAGVGLNQAHNFTITPKIFEEVPAPLFGSHTTTSFAYTVGTGLQKPIKEHWHISLGYEFSDWGKSELSRAPGQTLNRGLHLTHLYTNTAQLSLSYIA